MEMKSFNEKLSLWKIKISTDIFDFFATVNKFQDQNKIGLIGNEILNTLSQLQSSLQHYFPSLDINIFAWVLNPLAVSEEVILMIEEEEQLIDIRHNKLYQTTFTNTTLEECWLAIGKVYP